MPKDTPETETNANQMDLFNKLKGQATAVEGRPVPIKKDDLVEVPFIVTGWETVPTDKFNKEPYLSIAILMENGEERAFSIGSDSTGVPAQLAEWKNQGLALPYFCSKGLRFSEFANEKTGGRMVKTFYIA